MSSVCDVGRGIYYNNILAHSRLEMRAHELCVEVRYNASPMP